MRPSSRPLRMPSRLSGSLHHQLNMYAIAASAAGVSLAALSQPADAKIIYTKTHQVITPGFPYFLSFGDEPAFEIAVGTNSTSTGSGVFILGTYLGNPWANSVAAKREPCSESGGGCALPLKKGAKIPTKFANPRDAITWPPGTKNRYLGLTFYLNGSRHYGWARMSILNSPQLRAVVTGYAYETIPGKPIIAGRTEEPDVTTEQLETAPVTLGALAMGRR